MELVALTNAPVGVKTACFVPLSQTDFACALIPAEDRENPGFDGVSLVLSAKEVMKHLSQCPTP